MSSNPAGFFLKIEITLDSISFSVSTEAINSNGWDHDLTNFHIDWRSYESLEFCRRMEITFCLSCSTNIRSVDWKYLSSFAKLFGKSKMIIMIIRDRGYFDSNPLNSSIYLSLSAIILLTLVTLVKVYLIG